MDKHKAEAMAIELIAAHLNKNPGAPRWRFQWNSRSAAAGLCSYYSRTIELSAKLVPYAEEAEVRDTILHEIAHALTPGHHHDKVWSAKAREIGADGKRCYSEESKPATMAARKLFAKYVGTCPNGHVSYKSAIRADKQSCGRCSRKYDERYLITWRLNEERKG
jgi:predicted SprT family Zn-dependent metalloprotease